MKRSYLLIVGLVVFVVLAVGAQGGGEKTTEETTEVPTSDTVEDLSYLLEPSELQAFLANPPEEIFFVDTRTPEEYVDGHIPTAIQIDYRDIGNNPPTDDRDALIILYCRSGNRSNTAANTLIDLGYTRVVDWGGIINWPYAVVTGNSPE
jgi:phage shock protein E